MSQSLDRHIVNTHDNYKIAERSIAAIDKFGSVDNAIINLQTELNEHECSWSMYSSDCLGHAIQCCTLMIEHLKNRK